MAFADYMPYETGELTDEIYYKDENQREITVGNVSVTYSKVTKTFSMCTSSDEEWSVQSIECFRRILDYIETAYASLPPADTEGAP